VYVIDHGRVRWEPALNLNMVILGGQIVAIVMSVIVARFARVLLERRSTQLGGIRALTARAERKTPWARPLARVRVR
jgi:hypothetical protein